MRTQRDRDEQTVVIATALGLFTGVLVAVGLIASCVQWVTHGLGGHAAPVVWPAVLLAGIAAGSYVARSRR